MGWSVGQCDEMLDRTTKEFFKRNNKNSTPSLTNIAKWWIQDEMLNEHDLESVLKDIFTLTRRLLDPPYLCLSGTKVFVTATSTSHVDPIVLSNFKR